VSYPAGLIATVGVVGAVTPTTWVAKLAVLPPALVKAVVKAFFKAVGVIDVIALVACCVLVPGGNVIV
jgi:hypothetical protein